MKPLAVASIPPPILLIVALQIAALVMLFFFPGIATWLPRAIGW